MMSAEVVHASNDNVHEYGTAVIDRALRFSREYDLDANPQVLWANLAGQMISPQPTMICIAGVDDGEVVGHLTASLINFHGSIGVLVESLSIDKARQEGREQTMRDGWEQMIEWGRSHGATFIRAWAMTDALAIVFKRFGLQPKPYRLVETKIDGGE